MSDELHRIARIKALLAAPAPQIVVGIGDDAAVLHERAGRVALSVDAAVDEVHFCRAFMPLPVIGERAFVTALSDLAAIAAVPCAALSALVLPAAFSDAELDQLVAGIARAAQRYGAPVVGGNLAAGAQLSITTTVVGELTGAPLLRSGARAGDRVYVTGTLGGAALGLLLLRGARAEAAPECVERFLRPTARIDEALALRGVASAAIDVSDGLVQDLGHVCAASRVGARIDATLLPLPPGLEQGARASGVEPLTLALSGGDDYELLFCAPAGATPAIGTCIGEIIHGDGVTVHGAAGAPVTLTRRGYRHFGG